MVCKRPGCGSFNAVLKELFINFCQRLPALAGVCAAQTAFAAVTGGFSVEIGDREAVRTFYNAVYGARSNVRSDWTGSVSNCVAGTTSQDYQNAVLTRLNFYRAMIGAPAGVIFREDYSLRAAHAALIMSATDEISHFPDEDWHCYTVLGAEGADNSNLALGSAGMEAIDGYMIDSGPNYRVGHRRWVIYPKTQIMGTGDIDPPDGSSEQRANSLWIFDDHFSDPRPKTRESFVAWPPPGFVPHTLVYPRWSFQISGANFTNAVVTVSSNGTPVAVHKEKVETGYGENAVVFVPHGITPQTRMFWPKPAQDVTYSVQIDNIVVRGNITNYAYQVVVFDPEKPLGDWASARLSGSANPPAERLSRYTFPTAPKATSHEFRASRLEAHTGVEGAEEANPGVVAAVSALFPLVQTEFAASGSNSFHLIHARPLRPQSFILGHTFVPSSASELRFQSRLAGATADQIARVEVSLDEGSSWREVHAQAGSGGNGEEAFALRTVSLAPFAGRAIWVRFNYGFIFGPASNVKPGIGVVGWYIDDIEVTAAQRLADPIVTAGSVPSFDFVPPTPGEYYLDVRPRFYEEFKGEWSLGSFVIAPPPEPPQILAGRIKQKNGSDLEIEFTATSLPINARLVLQRAESLNSSWTDDPTAEIAGAESEISFRAAVKKGSGSSGFYRIVAQ